ALDAATVTAATVQVGAGQVPVAGRFTVDADQVTFTPDVQWHLRGDIDVVVTTAVESTRGAVLPEAATTAFHVADGAWQPPEPIGSGVACCSYAQSNLRGDIVFPFPTAGGSVSVITFDAATQTFAPAAALETSDRAFEGPIAAIGESGEAIVAWRGELNVTPETVGWSRRRGGEWSAGQTQDLDNLINQIAIGDDGTALAIWGDASTGVMGARLAPAAPAWTQPAELEPGASSWGARQVGGDVQVIFESAADGLFSRTLDPGTGELGEPSPIGAAGVDVNYVNHAALADGGAIFSWWQPADDEIRFGRFDPGTGEWSEGRLGDGQGGSQVCENASGKRIGAFQDGGTALAAVAAPGQGFGLPDDLGAQSGLEYAGCFLDRFGSGHGLWAGYGTDRVFWSRHHPDGTWDSAIEVVESPAMRGWSTDAYGNLTILYASGTDAFARRFR
ncbi:MAG TPA: hypothetical protein VK698_02500, partial [Kofleriaceae bacterium]|nr:hypothetical protein [Kofleriaceae bacterium]